MVFSHVLHAQRCEEVMKICRTDQGPIIGAIIVLTSNTDYLDLILKVCYTTLYSIVTSDEKSLSTSTRCNPVFSFTNVCYVCVWNTMHSSRSLLHLNVLNMHVLCKEPARLSWLVSSISGIIFENLVSVVSPDTDWNSTHMYYLL